VLHGERLLQEPQVRLLAGEAFFSGLPLQYLAFLDIGLVVLLSGGLALIWGVVLRPVLALLALRAKGLPGDAGTPEKARVSVPA
jgi:hypothetical protein